MPTCPGFWAVPSEPGIMTRSPLTACVRLVGSGLPEPACAAALCGSAAPAAAHAAIVSPEQSNEFGPEAPHTYGLPSCLSAYCTAALPLALPLSTIPAGTVVVPAMLLPLGPTMLPAGVPPVVTPPPPGQMTPPAVPGCGPTLRAAT